MIALRPSYVIALRCEGMSAKRGETYSSVVSFLRRIFRFDLLKTCIIALRGYKKPSGTPAKIETLDMLHGFEGNCYILLRITDVMTRCFKKIRFILKTVLIAN